MEEHIRSSTSSVSISSDSSSSSLSTASSSDRQESLRTSFSMDDNEAAADMTSEEEISENTDQTSSSSMPTESEDLGDNADDEESDESLPDPNIDLVINSHRIISKFQATQTYLCRDITTEETFICSVIPSEKFFDFEAKYARIRGHPGVNQIQDVFTHQEKNMVIYVKTYGNFHEYCRTRPRMAENEAIHFFHQILLVVHDCHNAGIMLRDLKLRAFVFKDPEKRRLVLETWVDACLLSDPNNDCLSDRYGCPTYASPELLAHRLTCYSGKKADAWSLGIMLYAMLAGRYPFYHRIPSQMLHRIERGFYIIPDFLSREVSEVLHGLLARNPTERFSTTDVLNSDWFRAFNRHNVTEFPGEPRLQPGPGLSLPQILNHPLHQRYPFSQPASTSSVGERCPPYCDNPTHHHPPFIRPPAQLNIRPSTSRAPRIQRAFHADYFTGESDCTDQIVPEVMTTSPSDDDSPLK